MTLPEEELLLELLLEELLLDDDELEEEELLEDELDEEELLDDELLEEELLEDELEPAGALSPLQAAKIDIANTKKVFIKMTLSIVNLHRICGC